MPMQKSISKINSFYTKNKRMPSFREIAELVGYKSKNAVAKLVDKLVESGMVERDSTGKLLPGVRLREIPLLGTVEAGFPTAAEEELVDTLSLDDYLVRNKEATFLLRVKGDSMIEAGIMPGDLVLVERGREARLGDIVIAEVDHEWTMKYLQRRNGKSILLPGNPKYPPIIPQQELKIGAVVKAVVRRYV